MSSLRIRLARTKTRVLKTVYKATDALLDSDKHIRYTYHQNGYHNADYRFPKTQINFIHLPKTGGTSFCKMLKADEQDRFVYLDIHKPISIHCSPSSFQYVTIMREPVARVWSYYQMVLRSPEGYPYQRWARKGLKVFLEKCWAARNMSCRYLTARVKNEPDAHMAELAFDNLERFYAVLDFTHFSEEAAAFMKQHGIPYERVPNERNHPYVSPSPEETALIKHYNSWDIAVYDRWLKAKSGKNE